jgi:hypothetical protein
MSVGDMKRTLQAPRAKEPAPRAARTAPEARMWAEKRQRQRRDRAAIARGEATPESMHLIPPKIARKTTGRFKNVTFDDYT